MRRRLRDGRDGRAIVEELERIGDALPEGPEKSHWFLELAVACEMLVPERQRALALYIRAVELDPANGEAIDRGRLVCREIGRVDELIRLTEIDLARESDETRRERLTALIGDALLDAGNRNRAAAFLVSAAGQFPASLTIQDALGTVGYDDDWKREVDRLIAIGDNADADSGARVSLRAARILRMEAPEDERYEALLLRVLDYDAYNENAFAVLDALYAQAGRWDDIDALQDRLVQAFPGKEEQSALSQRFAFSWIARAQHDRAARWCWRAIELGGLVYPIAGLTMLRGIYGSRRDWDKLLAAVDAILSTPLDEDSEVHTALLGGTIAWKARADLVRARGYFDRVRRVAIDSLLLIDFDDAEANARNPETLSDEQRALIDHARRLSKSETIDRAIDAWKKAIAADPTKRAPRRALARLLQRGERWRTLADALKDEEQRTAVDDAERVALLFQLAALYRDRLRQDLLLTQTLQRIVDMQPGNLAALDQLEAAFAQMRRWPDVAATIEKKRNYVTDPNERLTLQLSLAQLYQEKLNNESEAIKALEVAFSFDSTRPDIFDRLAGSYTKRREWEKLFALKRQRAETLREPKDQLQAALELAQLATDKLKKPALAIEAWSAVLALDAHAEPALAALEKLFAAEQDHGKLAKIYARRAESPADANAQLIYLTKLAQLCSTELDDAPRAIAAWQRVLSLSPGHGRALESLKRLYVAARAWDPLELLFADEKRLEECARLFERQAQDEAPAVQVELLLRAGRIFGEALNRRDAAVRVLERVLTLDGKSAAATAALVHWYEEAGDAKKLAHVLALEIANAPVDDVAVGKARLLRLAGLHGRELHDAPGAFAWQLQAFRLEPRDDKLRPELERLAARVNGWAQLISAYEAVCEHADMDRVALLSVVAREKETALGDVDGALATWQQLAALEPPPAAALQALARIYEARQAWRELHDVYARKLTLAHDADARRPIVIAMAALAERQGDDSRAIADYRQLVAELGPDAATLAALERLYERAADLANVEATLLQWRELVGKSPSAKVDKTPLDFRLADTRRRLGRVSEAIVLYGDVLASEPNHAGARAALEAIADGDDQPLQAALLLEPILRATGASDRLARVLRIRIAHAADLDETVALMHELAWLEERELGRRDDAFATLAQALKTNPSHTPTFDALERLSDGKWERLAALYKEVATRPLSISEHVEVRCRLGGLYRDRLHEPERALATFNRVLDLAPDNPRAEAAIDGLLAASGRHAERAERLKQLLLADSSDFTRALKLAHLYERELGDAPQAMRAYLDLLAREPERHEPLSGLERLFFAGPPTLERAPIAAVLLPRYQKQGRIADVVRVWAAAPEALPVEDLLAVAHEAGELETLRAALGAAAARAFDPRARAGLRRAHAALERDRGEVASAESLLRLALTDWPEDLASLRALDALLAMQERAKDRVPVLAKLVTLLPLDQRQVVWLLRGELQTQLGDVEGARAALKNALDLGEDARTLAALARMSDDEEAIVLWQRLHARAPRDQEALAALAGLYERHERWRELGEVLEQQLADAPKEAMAPLLEQQALVWTRLDDVERAIATWRRLIALAPDATDALRGLARLYRARERHAELAETLATLLPKLPRGEQLPIAVQLAELYDKLERRDEAVAAWQRVLTLDPQQQAARDVLAAHGVAPPPAVDPAAAIAELAARAASASGAQRRELYLELGALHESALELSAAIAAYRTVLPGVALLDLLDERAESVKDAAQRLGLYDALADEAARMERWARAVEATRRAAELEPSGAARAQRLYRAGIWCRDQLADFDEALACFEAAARNFGAAGTVAPQPLDDAIARLRARGARAPGPT